MNAPQCVLTGILSIGLFAAPLAGQAQPALEQFRFDPPRLCPRDTFQWGFSYRGLPGGLAAVKDFEMRALWEGPGERPIRSLLTPTRDDLQPYTADQGRFESRLTHAGPPRKAPAGGTEIRYTLRVVLADGQEVTSATSVRYVDACPPPPLHLTLGAGPTGRIGVQTTTPTVSDFLQGIRPAATSLIWGDLKLPRGRIERSPAVVLVHGSGGVGPREDRWAEELRQPGAATFVLDSFTGRGIAGTAEDQSQISSLAMIGDAYRALELLATHPRIDPATPPLLLHVRGRPRGDRSADPALPRDGRRPRPRRALSRLRGAPPASRRRRADHRVRWGPSRAFDRPSGGPARHNPREQNGSRCFWEERPEGQLVNRDTGRPFSLSDPCMVLGGTFGRAADWLHHLGSP